MLVRDVPVADRPRERLARLGASVLSDRELIAVLLRTGGVPGASVHELAERLLAEFGGVAALARASISDLSRLAGVGPAKAAALLAAFELGRRADGPDGRVVLDSSSAIAAAARPLLAARSRE